MPTLSLTKTYADGRVLYYNDLHQCFGLDLANFINTTGVDTTNVQVGFAKANQVSYSANVKLLWGATQSAYMQYVSATNYLTFGNTSVGADTYFSINGVEQGRLKGDGTYNFTIQNDIYFAFRSTTYGLFRHLAQYRKPVLVWLSANQIYMENNTEVANETLAMLPSGPVSYAGAVTVLTTTGNITNGSNQLTNLAATTGVVAGQPIVGTGIPAGTIVSSIVGATVTMSQNATATTVGVSVTFYDRFRSLHINAVANGYAPAHTGAANSGIRSGLALTNNTWYYIYLVRVQGGTDAGNNFILVLDDQNPTMASEGTLNTHFTAYEWLYLGAVRYGYGSLSTTQNQLVKFVMDHQGWTTVIANDTTKAAGILLMKQTALAVNLVLGNPEPGVSYNFSIGNGDKQIPSCALDVQLGWHCDKGANASNRVRQSASATTISTDIDTIMLPIQSMDTTTGLLTEGGHTWRMPVYSTDYAIDFFTTNSGYEGDAYLYLNGWCDHYV